MSGEKYNLFSDKDYPVYWFKSYNSKGKNEVLKAIRFKYQGNNLFNLSLADVIHGRFDYYHSSGNNDTEMVFRTLAEAVINFTIRNPNARIYFEGNTEIKQRLYRIQVTKYLIEIEKNFNVFGFNREWVLEKFIPNICYKAILVERK